MAKKSRRGPTRQLPWTQAATSRVEVSAALPHNLWVDIKRNQSALCLFNFYFSFFCDLQFFATGWAANGV